MDWKETRIALGEVMLQLEKLNADLRAIEARGFNADCDICRTPFKPGDKSYYRAPAVVCGDCAEKMVS